MAIGIPKDQVTYVSSGLLSSIEQSRREKGESAISATNCNDGLLHWQGCRKRRGLKPPAPQFLADQLTLSQPGGNRLCPPNNTGTPGFSDLPTALQWSWSGTMDLCIEIRVRDRLDLCVIVLLKRKLTHSRRINSTLIVCAGSRDWR